MSKQNYWRYYVRVPYESPVSKTVLTEDDKEVKEYKCAYPIRLLDWDEYNPLAHPIFNISPTLLTRRLKLDLSVTSLFEFVVYALIKEDRLWQLEKVFSMAFREEVKAMVYRKGESQEIRFVFASDNAFYIDKNNFTQVREVLMEQAFYFDPIVGEDERSQKLIDKAISRLAKKGSDTETNIESMVSLVKSEYNITDWTEYTYYELRIDYYTIIRKENFRAVHVYRAFGGNNKIPEFGAISEAHSDPFGEDVLFKRNDRSRDTY